MAEKIYSEWICTRLLPATIWLLVIKKEYHEKLIYDWTKWQEATPIEEE